MTIAVSYLFEQACLVNATLIAFYAYFALFFIWFMCAYLKAFWQFDITHRIMCVLITTCAVFCTWQGLLHLEKSHNFLLV